MRKPVMRIPYTDALAAPTIRPATADTLSGAVRALAAFLTAPSRVHTPATASPSTLVLSGAGLSVASGLADYRGPQGTYRVNKSYRPIYYGEFVSSHEARKRYWARSFLGWSSMGGARPNPGHHAIADLASLGFISGVITQNVDSFHPRAHPSLPTLELHGYLRNTVCTTCRSEYPRDDFQQHLARLNPKWAALLREAVDTGALGSSSPSSESIGPIDASSPDSNPSGSPRGSSSLRGIRTNPDGDVDLPDAPYTTFRYPPCPQCHADPPRAPDGTRHVVEADAQGAWAPPSTAGILKPSVVMFGENIDPAVKDSAEHAVDSADRLLVLGTSLATYSAWRIAKRAVDRGMPIAIVNMGGVRGEDHFFADLPPDQGGELAVRTELPTHELLPELVAHLRREGLHPAATPGVSAADAPLTLENPGVFKDMLS